VHKLKQKERGVSSETSEDREKKGAYCPREKTFGKGKFQTPTPAQKKKETASGVVRKRSPLREGGTAIVRSKKGGKKKKVLGASRGRKLEKRGRTASTGRPSRRGKKRTQSRRRGEGKAHARTRWGKGEERKGHFSQVAAQKSSWRNKSLRGKKEFLRREGKKRGKRGRK